MTATHLRVFYLAILSLLVTSAWAELKIKHGEWSATVEMTGMPIALPPQTMSYCVDKDSAVPQDKQQKDCTMEWKSQANTVQWTMTCANGGKGKGLVTYGWDTMQGQTEISVAGGNLMMKANMTGKWVSEKCSN
jgi:hypothetical protein